MTADTCVCPDGKTLRKVWHLFAAYDTRVRSHEQEYRSVCGVKAFDGKKGACLPHCFCEDWLKVNCPACLAAMQKGLPTT